MRSHQRHGSGYGWHVLELAVARALEQVVAQVQGLERRRTAEGVELNHVSGSHGKGRWRWRGLTPGPACRPSLRSGIVVR